MTAKKSPAMRAIEAYIEKIKPNLAYAAGPIIEDAHFALHDAINATDSEETVEALIDDYLLQRPNLLKSKVLIPEALQAAAFGEHPSLKAQGEITKRYGIEAATECAARWRASLGSLTPGRDPEGGVTVAAAKKVLEKSEAEAPSKNPWHPRYPAKTQAERFAAQASIIKGAGSKAATSLARSAGVTLDGRPLPK